MERLMRHLFARFGTANLFGLPLQVTADFGFEAGHVHEVKSNRAAVSKHNR